MVTRYKITSRKMTRIRGSQRNLVFVWSHPPLPPTFPRQPLSRGTESSFRNVFSRKISYGGRFTQKTRRKYIDSSCLSCYGKVYSYIKRGNISATCHIYIGGPPSVICRHYNDIPLRDIQNLYNRQETFWMLPGIFVGSFCIRNFSKLNSTPPCNSCLL
jgi:hypothetical protein